MVTSFKLYSEKDIKRIVKEEVKKRFFTFERLLNTFKGRSIDIEKILEYRDRKLKENRK